MAGYPKGSFATQLERLRKTIPSKARIFFMSIHHILVWTNESTKAPSAISFFRKRIDRLTFFLKGVFYVKKDLKKDRKSRYSV
jgi:hypothetical protein